jgi:N-acetylglucosaminyl-diphospho-decaprenol L-rhamnosyltransferase
MSLSIDVVVPTRDRWELTERCLKHLQEQTASHTVIVADNASADGTPARIRDLFEDVRLVETGGNLGFSAACNRGAAAGSGDVVVLLNNDVEVRPDFLERLVRPLESDPRVGLVAALLVRPGEQTIDCVGLTADPTLAGFARLRGRPASEASASCPVLSGPSGAGGAYRRASWEEVEGLDEGVLFYGEDLDLALRIRSAGWATALAPDAVGVHLGSASTGHRSTWQRYQGGFARGYFLRRYRVLQTRVAARAILTEGIVVAGDAVLSRDLAALRGRLAGWHAAKGVAARRRPPEDAIDAAIGFSESLHLRRVAYAS